MTKILDNVKLRHDTRTCNLIYKKLNSLVIIQSLALEVLDQKYLLTFFHLVSLKKLEMPSQEAINNLQREIDRIKQRLQGTDLSLVFSKL